MKFGYAICFLAFAAAVAVQDVHADTLYLQKGADSAVRQRRLQSLEEVRSVLAQPTSVTSIEEKKGGWTVDFSNGETLRVKKGKTHAGDELIVGIAESSGGMIDFTLSDGSSVSMCGPDVKRIAAWGDSLTPNYVPWLRKMLGSGYDVVDCGVPGETTTEIAGRQGGVPMVLGRDLSLPAKAGERVFLGTDLQDCDWLLSAYPVSLRADAPQTDRWYYNFNYIRPYRQNPHTGELCMNPCVVDGVECRFTREGKTGQYGDDARLYVERVTDGAPVVLRKGSVVYTSAMKNLRNLHANIFFMGQNNGFTTIDGREDVDILIDQYRKMIDYSGSDRYVVVSFPYRAKMVDGEEVVSDELLEIERRLSEAFGDRLINIRQYFSTLDLDKEGVTPLPGDEKRMKNGFCPKALLNNNGKDPVHFNTEGYRLLASLIHSRLRCLGFTD